MLGRHSGQAVIRRLTNEPLAAADSLLLEASTGVYLAVLNFEPEHAGATDAADRSHLEDKRMFPSLLGVESMQAMNERGEVIGDIVFDGACVSPASIPSATMPRSSSVLSPAPVGMDTGESFPGEYALGPVFPNPFN